jgi:hypothetical protein
MSWIPALSGWAFALLALIPPAIIALYFLKLRRNPMVVPSTYLWVKTIEDLHVNSLWQKLQKNILLYLQLLFIGLLILSLLRPGCRSESSLGKRSILLIDHSASMNATDEVPTRLEKAKEKALEMIDTMSSDDVSMIIAFSDRAEVRQGFTSDRRQLRAAVESINPTQRTTDAKEALRAAAGLANPGRTSQLENVNDIQVAEALPATLFILSDGGFPEIQDFDLGNLSAQYIPIGKQDANNVGIIAFTVERNIEHPDEVEAYARLVNYSDKDIEVTTELLLDDNLIDASQTSLKPGSEEGVNFQIKNIDQGELKLRIDVQDNLAIDNEAFATLTTAKPIKVLLVTKGNNPLELGLRTSQCARLATTTVVAPEFLQRPEFLSDQNTDPYDLMIFDRCSPPALPACNTLFIGSLPPGEAWSLGPSASPVFVVDVAKDHPLMQYLEIASIRIVEAAALKGPTSAIRLIEADCGPVMAIAPREAYQDVVCSISLLRDDGTDLAPNTDWPLRRSFPVFLLNTLEFLGGAGEQAAGRSVLPGQSIPLALGRAVEKVDVKIPSGQIETASRGSLSQIIFTQTEQTGVYSVTAAEQTNSLDRFTVNLFSVRESQIKPQPSISFGAESIAAAQSATPKRIDYWRWIALLAAAVLAIEWITYNRRLYF